MSIGRAAEEISTRFGSRLTLRLEKGIRTTSAVQDALRRITREATINAARHGHAQHIVVSLEAFKRGLRLRVEDDGSGFDVGAPSGGFGLISMRERAASLGGEFTVRSELGFGTITEVVLQ